MSLNIKNEAVHDLVREAARRTGKSQTSVVEVALRKYLDELERTSRRDEVDEIVARMQRLVAEADARAEGPLFTAEDLYDPETGLPA